MPQYTALTIGPIYKTIQMARSTKAVWAASYMFSYLMRKIIDKGIQQGVLIEDNILLPRFENAALNDDYKLGVGLFPDRLIYKGKVNNFKQVIDEVIEEFARDVYEKDFKNGSYVTEKEIKDLFNGYFRIIPLTVQMNTQADVILKIYEYLDAAELSQKINPHAESEKYLIEFLEKYRPNYNFLHRTEFGDRQFKSTAEIATAEFAGTSFYEKAREYIRRDKESDQSEYYQKIRNGAGRRFRNYQKYMAIVQADGDNFGQFIKQLYQQPNSETLVRRFSMNLWHFSKEAVELINRYNGTPIYAGGDDLLFFCPVAHTRLDENGKALIEKTLFDLIDEIDGLFDSWFTRDSDFQGVLEGMSIRPTMSYGVSISYYKFPLNEARELTVQQLFYQAKGTCHKNAVSYAVLKHSGQYYGATFHKDRKSYKTFKKMLKSHGVDGNFIHSVAQKLEPLSSVIFEIGKVADTGQSDKMFDHFFENNFDEGVHTRKKPDGTRELIPFLKDAKQLFKDIYAEAPVWDAGPHRTPRQQHEANMRQIYAALRFLEFINNTQER